MIERGLSEASLTIIIISTKLPSSTNYTNAKESMFGTFVAGQKQKCVKLYDIITHF